VRGTVPSVLPEELKGEDYVVATIHRADNTDDARRLRGIAAALAALPVPVLLSAHPRLIDRAQRAGVELARGNVRVLAPLSYPDMVAALLGARGVVTDSGGLQKEAFLLGTPCTTLRTETEWAETLEGGWNVVVDPEHVDELPGVVLRPMPTGPRGTPYGTGDAAQRVVSVLDGSRVPPLDPPERG
jgi:UDP-N-acetylglucosamine 2-epimerase (non-hydrolysing)